MEKNTGEVDPGKQDFAYICGDIPNRGVPPRGAEIIPYELDAVNTAERTLFIALTEGTLCYISPYYRIMKIYINRELAEVGESQTLSEILESRGIGPAGVAVAINNRVVPRAAWLSTHLADGDTLTVIKAVCGG